MDTGLAGKVVVVTGSTANIGKAIALAFAEEGCTVVVVGRDAIAGQRVVDEARRRGAADVLWRPTDVVDHDDVNGLIAETLQRFGVIDVLVNNCGGNIAVSPFVDTTIDQWRYDIDLTLTTTLNCTHAVLPHMLERGAGRIINIGSMSAFIGDRFMAVYSAAKGAVHSFTKVLALEVGKSGITVNAIAPYGTMPEDPFGDTSTGSRFQPHTGLFPRELMAQPELVGLISRDTALTRPHAKPSEIGAAAVYLASEQAAFITGQVLQVDGGVQLP